MGSSGKILHWPCTSGPLGAFSGLPPLSYQGSCLLGCFPGLAVGFQWDLIRQHWQRLENGKKEVTRIFLPILNYLRMYFWHLLFLFLVPCSLQFRLTLVSALRIVASFCHLSRSVITPPGFSGRL